MEKYEKLEKIGEGSYGEVWKVKLKKDPPSVKSKFVLKLISLEKANTKEREFADQEAKLLKSLKHPNIVSCKDTFLLGDDRHPALGIVMSFCEGGDLHQKLRTAKGVGKLSEREVMQWFIQITLAVQFLHSKKILHRDLKTQNVFLTRSNLVKVGDLGIAKVLEEGQMALTLIGTPYYMSPEVFQNIPYNFKSDIWSLGCILYEMTSLKHAFTAQDFRSLVNKVVSGQMPHMPSEYSAGVIDLISQMLQYKPDQRPSAQDILKKSFIQKNIESFLSNTSSNSKQKKNSPKSTHVRPCSGAVSRKKSNSGSRDEPDNMALHAVVDEKPFFADNDLPTVKQQHVSPQIKQSRSPSIPNGVQSSNDLRESTEDFTLTPKKKLSSPSFTGAAKQLLPDMKDKGRNGDSLRNSPSIGIQSNSRKFPSPGSKQSLGGSAPSTMLKEMVSTPPATKQPPSPSAQPSCSKKFSANENQPPKSAAPPTIRQKSEPGKDQEVRRSKPREERLKKKEQEFAEKDFKKRRPHSALVTSSDGHSDSNGGSPLPSDDSDASSMQKSEEKSEKKEEARRSSVFSLVSEADKESNLNMSGDSASPSDNYEYMHEEMDDLRTLLTATLHMDQHEERDDEMLPRDFANSHISANTIAPALQTITMSAKPKDRMKVLQRELETAFPDDVIVHCLEVMMSSKDEETEDILKGILGEDKFETYIGKLWHLMLLKKSNNN